MKASKSGRSWLGRGSAQFLLGIALCSAAVTRAEGGLETTIFGLGSSHAVPFQTQVELPFTIGGLPGQVHIVGFGFGLEVPSPLIRIARVRPALPGTAQVYLVQQEENEGVTRCHFEVFCPEPCAFSGGLALSIGLNVHYPLNEDEGDPPENHLVLPVSLLGGGTSWITAEGFAPLFPVPNLQDGAVELDLKNGVTFGDATGARGSVVEVPVSVSALEYITYLTVGVDYDEDMLELLSVATASESAPFAEALAVRRNGSVDHVLQMKFSPGGLPYPQARVPVAVLRFWISPDVEPGSALQVGRLEAPIFASGTNQVSAVIFETGSILVEENLSQRFIRGDANGDGKVNASDAVQILSGLFGKDAAVCPDRSDVNDDGRINLADVTALLSYVFGGQPVPPPPFPEQGLDPTYDELESCPP